ncbi:uncharacterized protein LOC131994085 [Stomoxys calcitrans]|uniref:uncharacterized protein LOC131994085 n=1 Tax=Stomoxys calcitrans TaxID=35570 RepID=UPI0027E3230A|nr:uncharacterized protein LOC131994085 [Stomoxys calcitrans]
MSTDLPSSLSEEASISSTSNEIESQKSSDLKNDKTFSRYRSLIVVECGGLKITTNEANLKRMQNLRRELNYLNETEWMYEPVDKKTP